MPRGQASEGAAVGAGASLAEGPGGGGAGSGALSSGGATEVSLGAASWPASVLSGALPQDRAHDAVSAAVRIGTSKIPGGMRGFWVTEGSELQRPGWGCADGTHEDTDSHAGTAQVDGG